MWHLQILLGFAYATALIIPPLHRVAVLAVRVSRLTKRPNYYRAEMRPVSEDPVNVGIRDPVCRRLHGVREVPHPATTSTGGVPNWN